MLYAIALGSNQRHAEFGSPEALIEEAVRRLPGVLVARSRKIQSRPLGPSLRRYANAVAIIDSAEPPLRLLSQLQQIERGLGRTRTGQRWRARTMDLDIILWEGGAWADAQLSIPHREYRSRRFVLAPLAEIASDWRDPIDGLSASQHLTRLDRPRPRA